MDSLIRVDNNMTGEGNVVRKHITQICPLMKAADQQVF